MSDDEARQTFAAEAGRVPAAEARQMYMGCIQTGQRPVSRADIFLVSSSADILSCPNKRHLSCYNHSHNDTCGVDPKQELKNRGQDGSCDKSKFS